MIPNLLKDSEFDLDKIKFVRISLGTSRICFVRFKDSMIFKKTAVDKRLINGLEFGNRFKKIKYRFRLT
ncbi:hypothetical protein A0128_03100 [Leptospira tipperaryensis]|uniref:Uncharacterized protein n=1 Tax=Leptospira tipperaryensis TaxID=2564040 RepID=A0A1D7UTJ2_9LEPT|nr:hypothetical protein A0128_03100 [Leptospira tipperaryensis]